MSQLVGCSVGGSVGSVDLELVVIFDLIGFKNRTCFLAIVFVDFFHGRCMRPFCPKSNGHSHLTSFALHTHTISTALLYSYRHRSSRKVFLHKSPKTATLLARCMVEHP